MGAKDPRVDAYIAKSAVFARPILEHIRSVVHEAMGQFGRLTSVKDLPPKRTLAGCMKKAKALNEAGTPGPISQRSRSRKGDVKMPEGPASALLLSRLALLLLFSTLFLPANPGSAQTPRSGNPILPGWYADPEAHVFAGEYWIFPTTSARYDDQTYMDAFSSPDLVTWTRHPRVLELENVAWGHRALWAPSVVEKDGWYYLFFSANDIQNDDEVGGIGVARSRSPAGPFQDYLGQPLIGSFHNGAQPIDPFVFQDDDGSWYLIYGGWRHCNIARLREDFTGFVPFEDGTVFREITPEGYVEGSFKVLKDGRYYFMWSEGGWTGPDYAVAYAVASAPTGPFQRVGKILQQDPAVATGAGHHSVLYAPGSGRWYIVYHRRPLGETDRNHRVVCIDELRFSSDGRIEPVTITFEGVRRDPVIGIR
jgi:hypothetical protein